MLQVCQVLLSYNYEIIMLLTALALLAYQPIQDKSVMIFNFTPNETIRYKMKTDMEMDSMGQSFTSSVSFIQTYKVGEISADYTNVQMSLQEVVHIEFRLRYDYY